MKIILADIPMGEEESHVAHVTSSFSALRSRGFLCDFKIRVGDTTFTAHRVILAANSEFFQEIFSSPGRPEKIITLDGIRPGDMQQCIQYMYTSRCNFEIGSILQLIELARFFRIAHMENDCLVFWRSNLSPENCLSLQNVARASDNDDILRAVQEYIQANLPSVMTSELFPQIEIGDFLHYISEQDHVTYWEAVRIYCRGREEIFLEILDRLEISSFPLNFLCTTVLRDPLSNSRLPETRRFVARAIFSDHTRLENEVNVQNCFLLKKLLHYVNDPIASGIMDLFMEKNLSTIISGPGFYSLSKEDVLSILQHSEIDLEEFKWEAILRWIIGQDEHGPSQNTLVSLSDICSCISLETLPLDILKEMLSEQRVVHDTAGMDLLTIAVLSRIETDRRVNLDDVRVGERDLMGEEISETDSVIDASEELERQLDPTEQDRPDQSGLPNDDEDERAGRSRQDPRRRIQVKPDNCSGSSVMAIRPDPSGERDSPQSKSEFEKKTNYGTRSAMAIMATASLTTQKDGCMVSFVPQFTPQAPHSAMNPSLNASCEVGKESVTRSSRSEQFARESAGRRVLVLRQQGDNTSGNREAAQCCDSEIEEASASARRLLQDPPSGSDNATSYSSNTASSQHNNTPPTTPADEPWKSNNSLTDDKPKKDSHGTKKTSDSDSESGTDSEEDDPDQSGTSCPQSEHQRESNGSNPQ